MDSPPIEATPEQPPPTDAPSPDAQRAASVPQNAPTTPATIRMTDDKPYMTIETPEQQHKPGPKPRFCKVCKNPDGSPVPYRGHRKVCPYATPAQASPGAQVQKKEPVDPPAPVPAMRNPMTVVTGPPSEYGRPVQFKAPYSPSPRSTEQSVILSQAPSPHGSVPPGAASSPVHYAYNIESSFGGVAERAPTTITVPSHAEHSTAVYNTPRRSPSPQNFFAGIPQKPPASSSTVLPPPPIPAFMPRQPQAVLPHSRPYYPPFNSLPPIMPVTSQSTAGQSAVHHSNGIHPREENDDDSDSDGERASKKAKYDVDGRKSPQHTDKDKEREKKYISEDGRRSSTYAYRSDTLLKKAADLSDMTKAYTIVICARPEEIQRSLRTYVSPNLASNDTHTLEIQGHLTALTSIFDKVRSAELADFERRLTEEKRRASDAEREAAKWRGEWKKVNGERDSMAEELERLRTEVTRLTASQTVQIPAHHFVEGGPAQHMQAATDTRQAASSGTSSNEVSPANSQP